MKNSRGHRNQREAQARADQVAFENNGGSVAKNKKIMEEVNFREGLLRFSDSLIASTSTESDQILVWESQTLAPLEQLKSDKFIVAPNTLQADYRGFVLGSHLQKTTLAAWKWDKPSQPCLRSPTKEELSVVRLIGG